MTMERPDQFCGTDHERAWQQYANAMEFRVAELEDENRQLRREAEIAGRMSGAIGWTTTDSDES